MLFPRPYPDEAIGSLLERACRRLGVSRKVLHRKTLDGCTAQGSFLLPAGLSTIADRTGMAPLKLLYGHTPYCYIVAYSAAETAEKLKQRLLLPSRATTYRVTRAIQLVLTSRGLRKYCPACVADDMARLGESYWRCSLQLPAVAVCVLHRAQLWFYLHPQGVSNHPLPQEVEGAPIPLLVPDELLYDLAHRSAALLKRRIGDKAHALTYRRLAAKAGYIKGGKLLAAAHLSRDLHRFYGEPFLRSVQCDYPEDHRIGWPSMMLRPSMPLNSFSTLRHILLDVFLTCHQASKTTYIYPAAGPKLVDYASLDRQFVNMLSAALSAIPDKINKSSLLKTVGIFGTFKHRRKELPKTEQFLAELASSPRYDRSKPKKRRGNTCLMYAGLANKAEVR